MQLYSIGIMSPLRGLMKTPFSFPWTWRYAPANHG